MDALRRIYRLHFQEMKSYREMEELLCIPSSTLFDYVSRIKGLEMSEEQVMRLSDAEFHALLFPNKYDVRTRMELPDFIKLHLELQRKNVTLKLLHKEYLSVNPDGYSYSCFCDHYRRWRNANKMSMLQLFRPGDSLLIDFAGQTVRIKNPETKEVIEYPLYVCCMGYSSYIFCKLLESQASIHFCEAVAESMTYFGGVPELLVTDNLRSAVIKANFYEPRFNVTFKELSDYYGTIILPARVRKPQDKSKVEIAVSVVERQILAALRDREFCSISEANAEISKLLVEVNDKVMIGYGKSRKELFFEYEASELKPLPEEPFIPRSLFSYKVRKDYHVRHDNRCYSVPYQYIGKQVTVEVTAKCVNIFYQNELIATHLKVSDIYGHSSLKEHMPISHQKMYEFNTITDEGLLIRAEKIGKHTRSLISNILASDIDKPYKKRRCFAIIQTAERSDVNEAELASAYTCELRDYRVTNYRNILKNKSYRIKGLDNRISFPEKKSENHENVRGSEAFI